ncbi:MAG: HPr kinase/phosphorylase [Firmicutes bacterium ADurb.Bin182]|nr:MAG: HPr kinase/phosphorylase [Firmicutes bacterium ADurb.Bin182]
MSVTIKNDEFLHKLDLECLVPGRGFLTIQSSDTYRPGLQFTGYFTHFAHERVQLIGNAEMNYLWELSEDTLSERMSKYMSYQPPCVICTRSLRPPEAFLLCAKEHGVPVFLSSKTATHIIREASNYMYRKLAPTITCHGVLLDVYGVGVMLMGDSGLGKSETSLELVKRGHRLVADDVVEITRVADDRISGSAPEQTRYLTEIRGIGIIDVRHMFGAGAIILEKSVDLVIEMELWQDGKAYDRLGLEEQKINILSVDIPKILMPVRPGRNMAIVVEVAARNFRLKTMGYDSAKEFSKRLSDYLSE